MTTLPPVLLWKPKEVVWWCWFQGFEKESSQLVLVPNCKWGWFKYKSLSATNLSIYLQKSKKYYVQLHCSKRAKINSTTLQLGRFPPYLHINVLVRVVRYIQLCMQLCPAANTVDTCDRLAYACNHRHADSWHQGRSMETNPVMQIAQKEHISISWVEIVMALSCQVVDC